MEHVLHLIRHVWGVLPKTKLKTDAVNGVVKLEIAAIIYKDWIIVLAVSNFLARYLIKNY